MTVLRFHSAELTAARLGASGNSLCGIGFGRMRRLNIAWWYASVIALIITSCFGIYWVAKDGYLGYASTHWPHSSGSVLAAHARHGRYAKKCSMFVQYEYFVEGVAYTNTTLSFPSKSETCYVIEKQLANIPIGSSIEVFYSPKHPAISCLLPGLDSFFLVLGGMAYPSLLALGIYSMKWTIQKSWFET